MLEAAGTDAEAVRVAGSAYMQLVAAAVLAADDPVSLVCVCERERKRERERQRERERESSGSAGFSVDGVGE